MQMNMPIPLVRDLVLVGGGHAHALVLRMWGMKPLAGTRLTLINPGPTAPYSGMLPGHIAGHYGRDDLDIDLVQLARFAGARLILGHAQAIDPVAKVVRVEGHGDVAYDVASIDVGIHAQMPDIAGFDLHGIGAKPLDEYARAWRDFLARAAAGKVAPEVAVIGGGIAGTELSLAMAHALRAAGCAPAATKITVVESGPEITTRTRAARRPLMAAMQALGVTVVTQARVARIEADAVILQDGQRLASRFTLGAAGAFAHPWVADSPLPVTDDGFIKVDAQLRVASHDDLFAVGDCAHMSHAPRPKAGVYAVRAGPVLFHNLRASLTRAPLRPYRPQGDYLKLVSLGGKTALAEKWGMSLAAPVLWRWKNRIDQKFMHMFRALPQMPAPTLPRDLTDGVRAELGAAAQPLCGGCGSKVGAGTLTQALSTLPAPTRSDVLSGPGDDAAVLQTGGQVQVMTTDHLRAFTDDPAMMARIAAVHALGDVWAMGAQPQAALLSLTLPRMSEALQARTLAEIMAAAGQVLRAAGAEIVGGHSTMGAEMTLGFTLTGLVQGRALSNGGGQPGDALILTRPIGSGTVLAAEMQGKARGEDVAHLLAQMARPQGDAAAILADQAHAMTDVTGFGLAGHLMAICRASGVAAQVDVQAVPLYPGALELAEAGHRSTLHASNQSAAPVQGAQNAQNALGAQGARAALLHDPQTAGGFLAAVPSQGAKDLVQALRDGGHCAAIIGALEAGPPVIRCV